MDPGQRQLDIVLPVECDTKIAIVLDEQLAVWQKANVTAFLISGIAGTDSALVGEPYVDGSGNRYLPMFRQPIMIYAADGPAAAASIARPRRAHHCRLPSSAAGVHGGDAVRRLSTHFGPEPGRMSRRWWRRHLWHFRER